MRARLCFTVVLCSVAVALNCAEGEERKRGPDGQSTCQPCPKGYHCMFAFRFKCTPGKFQDTQSQADCKPCPQGRYSTGYASEVCDKCPAGQASLVTGRNDVGSCADCPVGQTQSASPGTSDPVLCKSDTVEHSPTPSPTGSPTPHPTPLSCPAATA